MMDNTTENYRSALKEIVPLQKKIQELRDEGSKVFSKPHHGRSDAVVCARKKYAEARKEFDEALCAVADKFGKTPDEAHIDLANLMDKEGK